MFQPSKQIQKLKSFLAYWLSKPIIFIPLGTLGTGVLIISIGAIAGWPIMAGLLSFGLPLLVTAIGITVLGGILLLPLLTFLYKHINTKLQNKKVNSNRHSAKASNKNALHRLTSRLQQLWEPQPGQLSKTALFVLTGLSLLAGGLLVVGVGALLKWAVMVSLLSFGIPVLGLAIGITAIGSLVILGLLLYSNKRLGLHKIVLAQLNNLLARLRKAWQPQTDKLSKLTIAALTLLSVSGALLLTAGVGALCGWPIMVSLLSFGLPLLGTAIAAAAIGSLLVLGVLAFGYIKARRTKVEQPPAKANPGPARIKRISTFFYDRITNILPASIKRNSSLPSLEDIFDKTPSPSPSISNGDNSPLPLISKDNIKFDKDKDECIGKGAFGEVFKGKYRNKTVAIKKLLANLISDPAKKEFVKEANIMAQLNHPNIVAVHGIFEDSSYCIVMEYMDNSCLYDHLHNKKTFARDTAWHTRKNIAKDIACGLQYLHERDILHRDLKSLNILLDNSFRAKLADFGLAKAKTEITLLTVERSTVGTLRWMAPEILENKEYTVKGDMYSYAVTLWEMAASKIPFQNQPNNGLVIEWVKRGEREEIPSDCPPKIASLITSCWRHEPKSRPSAEEAYQRLCKSLR